MQNITLNNRAKGGVLHGFHRTLIKAAEVAGLCVLSLFLLESPAAAATLYTAGTTANVSNVFSSPFLRDSDSGPSSSYASITLANGEYGIAQAFYNGAVKVTADSERADDGAGDTIESRASQATIFGIESNTLAPGTLVSGNVNLHLTGRLLLINNPNPNIQNAGSAGITMTVGLRQAMPGPDEVKSIFGGEVFWRRGNGSVDKYGDFVGEDLGGLPLTDIFTGNAFLDIAFGKSVPFQGYVGDTASVEFALFGRAGISARSNFLNTGSFDISFDDPDVFAQVVPSVVPIPGAVWLLGSGLLGLAGSGMKRKKKVQSI